MRILRYGSIALLVAFVAVGAWAAPSLNPQQSLGKLLFFDSALSVNANQSCAACHAPEVGFTGPISEINGGGGVFEGSIPGRFGNRKPPTSAYATQAPVFHRDTKSGLFLGGNFWDGRATGERLGSPAAEQALGPFLNPLEQGLAAPADVVQRVCNGTYAGLFLQVCGLEACEPASTSAAYDCVGLAISSYEGSDEVNAFTSKYDYFLAGEATLTRDEQRGLALFKGKGKCANCHPVKGEPGQRDEATTVEILAGPGPVILAPRGDVVTTVQPEALIRPLFTDFSFDNLGVPRNPENPFYDEPEFNPMGENWLDLGLGEFLQSRVDYQQYAYEEFGKQKVPTLRNVDKRPYEGFVKAYGHNGYFKSLKDIVHFYNTRDVLPTCDLTGTPGVDCWPAPEVAVNVNRAELGDLKLTEADELAIVAFLKTLSDGYQP
jgi:cytochrome c peroxidase